MNVFEILRAVEVFGCMENLCCAKVLSKTNCARYVRYTRYLERKKVHPNETRYRLLVDLSIELGVSEQTLYQDIRMMETRIL